MTKLNVKKGDTVLVITGKESGKTAEVLDCFPEENKVTVKGINVLVKHKKPRSAQDKGGIIKLEGKLPASNVMVVCPNCNKATRVAYGKNEKGEKVRTCKKCGAVIDAGVKKATKKETVKVEKVEDKKPATKKASTEKKLTVKNTKQAETKVAKTVKTAPVKRASNTAKKIGGK